MLRYKFHNLEVSASTVDPKHEYDADLVVIPVVGRLDKVFVQAEAVKRRGAEYALIQYAFKSTQQPDARSWAALWACARCVWSYYDLERMSPRQGNFYHAPLGVDSDVFYPRPPLSGPPYTYVVATSGRSRLTESVREAAIAAHLVRRKIFHLGSILALGPHGHCAVDITDDQLATFYSDCDWVSGLRRVEGFELPAVEGLLCGTRPILFDRPHYRQWYDGFGEFIPEDSRQVVLDQLVQLFERGPRPVTRAEREEAVFRFSWDRILKGFWERCQS